MRPVTAMAFSGRLTAASRHSTCLTRPQCSPWRSTRQARSPGHTGAQPVVDTAFCGRLTAVTTFDVAGSFGTFPEAIDPNFRAAICRPFKYIKSEVTMQPCN